MNARVTGPGFSLVRAACGAWVGRVWSGRPSSIPVSVWTKSRAEAEALIEDELHRIADAEGARP